MEQSEKMIDGDLKSRAEWERMIPAVDPASLTDLIAEHHDLFEKVLSNLNILKLSEASLEAFNRIGMKLYEVKIARQNCRGVQNCTCSPSQTML